MARNRTVDLLPEIFKTNANKQFLSATLDQLVQNPDLKRVQGYIGRRFGAGVSYADSYLLEKSNIRTNYQLEPGVVFKDSDNKVADAITYPGILDALRVEGADVTRHDRLFASQQYSWDPSIDFDKFINYGQYYWLPDGPDAVDVQASAIAITDDYTVTKGSSYYTFSGIGGNNPTLTLVRGGNYTFNVDQDSGFWIQSYPGTSGTTPYAGNITSRSVLGVTNNGEETGSIRFNVPSADAQAYFHELEVKTGVDFVTSDIFSSIDGQDFETFGGIDGVKDIEDKTVVLLNPVTGQEKIIYRVNINRPDGSTDTDATISLVGIDELDNETQFTAQYGNTNGNVTFYVNQSGIVLQMPILTAANDTLYYQDGSNSNLVGIIKIVDSESQQTLDVENDIIGKAFYTSPNGVEFTNGLKIKFRGSTLPSAYSENEYYVEGVGSSIQLIKVSELHVTSTDSTDVDYLTIKRSSLDLNPWTRSNRWFHKSVIEKTAEYNESVATFNNDYRGKRPIIEFDAGLRLANFGTVATSPIDVIDFSQNDALSNVHGAEVGYSIDGHVLTNGSRVVFAADTDASVRNKIYRVQTVDPDDDSTEYGTIINLIPAEDASVLLDQVVLCLNGYTQEGNQYVYNGSTWSLTQSRESANQPPLFDVYDSNGNSFSDLSIYKSSNFTGSKLFSYKIGTGPVDPVLGFSLTYLNIDNIGDIVFENNRIADEFVYVSGTSSATIKIKSGFTRKYSSRTEYTDTIGWTSSVDVTRQRQVFTFKYANKPLKLDIAPRTETNMPAVKVYLENNFLQPSNYTITSTDTATTITFNTAPAIDSIIQVKIISDQRSRVAHYEIPSNLERNAFNSSIDTFSLGTIRNHYNQLVENLTDFSGDINGSNNTRDLGNIEEYGDVIVQNSAPLSATGFILRNEYANFFDAVGFAARQFEKFKYQLLDWAINHDTYGKTIPEILDEAIVDINQGKNEDTAFYWSDALLFGNNYQETEYTITSISTNVFNTVDVYDFTQANKKGLLVYLDDNLLIKDHDYTVATDGPRITLLITPTSGQKLRIREFASGAYGNYVPETPTKLGLFPKFKPEIWTDESYVSPRNVIQGHDGSLTVAFNDIRDEILLEFEKRIFNNIKVNGTIPLLYEDVSPGQFRTTDYLDSEITELVAAEFLDWAGWHRIDYKSQTYLADNEFTWNYSTASSKLDGSLLKGNWRGIYRYYYDTDHPHLHPWEMLGLNEYPTWWIDVYGPAPYTSGNLVMWEHLEAGYIAEPNNERYDSRYARPGLTKVIPVDSEGNLLSPMQCMVANYNQTDFKKSWVIGDAGPAENAWRRSSNWPFAVQKILALTKPAEYFALMIDRDRFKFNDSVGQYVYDGRYRIDVRDTELLSSTTPKNSYLNWIIERNRNSGISATELATSLSSIDVQLCYRIGGFTDKKYLKIFTDKSSPDSANTSLMIPDESYQLLTYKNQPFNDLQYSSVMIQKTSGGWAVYGNSQTKSYFRVLESSTSGKYNKISMAGNTYRIPTEFTDRVVRIPYGHTFTNKSSVVDFLVSYGKMLEYQGLIFDDIENNYVLDWTQMATEFLYWSNQGWIEGSLINLNPAATSLQFEKAGTIVDDLRNLAINEQPLDQNRQPLTSKEYAVSRIDNNFKITALGNNAISYLRLRSTSYENLLVLDNVSIFNDLVYHPPTGLRQLRLKLNGYVTANWTGLFEASGFLLNQDPVPQWNANRSYNKGDMVEYKNSYWAASLKIQPTEEFDFDDWTKIDYRQISTGMLPNIANKADQIRNYYNNSVANLETDADLLGLGITGFRSRSYLESLNIDDISQVSVYSNLIKEKGRPTSVELFNGVQFNKERSEYEVYENWAIKRATFGAKDNKRYIELELDKNKLVYNPSTIRITSTNQTDANQNIDINSIYKQSIKHTNPNILPVLAEDITDTTLPTAGYVNLDDVDVALFTINDLSEIDNNLDAIQNGSYVWIARINKYDWNVYRVNHLEVIRVIEVTDNLDGTLNIEFSGTTDLAVGEVVVIKFFDDRVDGAHRISNIVDLKNITVSGAIADSEETTITGNGSAFRLESVRLAQPSDLANQSYVTRLGNNDRVWVDNDINGDWKVYEKVSPFSISRSQRPTGTASNVEFGHSIAQGKLGTGAVVGAPAYQSGIGSLFCYNKENDYYNFSTIVSNNLLEELGQSLSMATNYIVAGAPGTHSSRGAALVLYRNVSTGTFDQRQILVAPDADTIPNARYGHAVDVSEDENWIYVGAIGEAKVHAYEKVEYQEQSARFVSDNNTASYNLTSHIKVDTADQIIVQVDGVIQTSSQFSLIDNVLTIYDVPAAGIVTEVTRKNTVSATGDGSTTFFSEPTELYTAKTIEAFSVYVDNVLQRPYYDYSYNTDSTVGINFATAPAADAEITFRASTYYRYVDTITGLADESFGHVIETTTDGQQVVIGAPTRATGGLDDSGAAYIYERLVERHVVRNSSSRNYNIIRTIDENNTIRVNDTRFVNPTDSIGANYSVDLINNVVIFDNDVNLTIGDHVEVDINEFNLIQEVVLDNNNKSASFGSSLSICRTDCSIYVGAPNDNWHSPESGSVTRFLNTSRVFGVITGNTENPAVTVGHSIRINNVDVQFTSTTLTGMVNDINNKNIPNIRANASDNKLTISIINTDQAPALSRMTVMPGIGTAYTDIGLAPFGSVQTIHNPRHEPYSHFGSSVHVDYSATNLIIGAEDASAVLPVTFNNDTTMFDSDTTEFEHVVTRSGAVYTYDLLGSASYLTAGQFVYGQELVWPAVNDLDRYGHALNYTDNLLIVTSLNHEGIGNLVTFNNPDRRTAWQEKRTETTVVDARLVNNVYIYDKETLSVSTYLDFIDPIQGKLLGAVKQNLDVIGAVDPAVYELGDTKTGILWGKEQVGKIWWNTENLRYVDYNQADILYSAKNWGQLFPGSSVDIYQWVESAVPPAQYAGSGTVVDSTRYSSMVKSQNGSFVTYYYFWVKNLTTVITSANKTLSASAIASYIENPQSSGIPYAALIRSNLIALYNFNDHVKVDSGSVLHVEYNKTFVDNNIFIEYDLLGEGKAADFLSAGLYRKLIDSFAGLDTLGNKVPDPNLSVVDSYGVDFRPRQSLFVDRVAALKNYITETNAVLQQHPFTELRKFSILNSEEPIPGTTSGLWDFQVADNVELGYQNHVLNGVGYRYLVTTDSENNNLWSIYEVNSSYGLNLYRVQGYDTKRYWNYIDWYSTGYSALTMPKYVKNTYSELATVVASDGEIGKVKINSNGKWELYEYNNGIWIRVGLEDGTIQISTSLYSYIDGRYGFDVEVFDVQYFDQWPTEETRQILTAINEELFINDFVNERNNLLISTFKYILAEQGNVEWLIKTSLVDVDHKIRELDQYSVYLKDNQQSVLDYINESKPYHVKIKEYLLRYEGIDTVAGNLFDFDVPSAYDASYYQFVSPILDDDIAILETDVSNREPTESIWNAQPYQTWIDNYLLDIDEIVIVNGGAGYTVAPQVSLSGDAAIPTEIQAYINGNGEVSSIEITKHGSGYRSTPTVVFNGGNTESAIAVAVTKNDRVRSISTRIKYDRYEYESQIVDWAPGEVYPPDQLVRYNDRVYIDLYSDGSSVTEDTFDPERYRIVPASTLSGIDRTMGFYVADVNSPGLDIALLFDGIDYPGVLLKGPEFILDSGFGTGGFDRTVFDNLEYGPEGLPTYSEAILDNEIFTSFTGSYPGLDLSGIDAVQATGQVNINRSTTEVTSITMTEVGKGYSSDVPPAVAISAPLDNITATARALGDGDIITGVEVVTNGFGYLSAPTVTLTAQEPTPGIQATASALLTSGSVTGVTMNANGGGYDSVPSVVFSDPPSVAVARATATATITNGAVSGTTIINGGSSYTASPAVTVTAPPASVNSTARAVVVDHELTDVVRILGGNYYSSSPTLSIGAPDESAVQATASANVSGGGVITSISVDQVGYLYDTPPTVTITPAAPTLGIQATATATIDTTTVGFDGDGFDGDAAFDAEGGIGTITVVTQGSGYTSAPTVTISAPDLSGGVQATATATISGDTAPLYTGQGYVVSITVTEAGTGYTSAPTVSLGAPDSTINHGTGASATAVLDNTSVISITVDNGGSYYDITPTISLSAPTAARQATASATVSNGSVDIITLTDAGWGYSYTPDVTVSAPDVTPVTAAFTANLTGDAVTSLTIDTAGAGYLTAPALTIAEDSSITGDIATGTATVSDGRVTGITVTNAGANYTTAPTITIGAPTGIMTHGSGATAVATIDNDGVATITVTNPGTGYDLIPTVTIAAPDRNTRRATAAATVVGGGVIEILIDDPGFGYLTTPTVVIGPPTDIDPDADIVGGQFVDVYNSHAPEELIPGRVFDTLDIRVTQRPGYDYSNNGHGFAVKTQVFDYVSADQEMYFGHLQKHPSTVFVYNMTGGVRLVEGFHYTINWKNKSVSVHAGAGVNDYIKVFVYGVGGGNQIYRDTMYGDEISGSVLIPIQYDEIVDVLVMVNGQTFTNYTMSPLNDDSTETTVMLVMGDYDDSTELNDTHFIVITVFGDNVAEDSIEQDLRYSFPETQVFVANAGDPTYVIDQLNLNNKNRENLIVEVNGKRLRPPTGHYQTGPSITKRPVFGGGHTPAQVFLPYGDEIGIDVDLVAEDEISVFLNNERLTLNVDYQVDPNDDSTTRSITFLNDESPTASDVVDIYITSAAGSWGAGYTVDSNGVLTITEGYGLNLDDGDIITVTSWNDSRELDISTQVFQGPTVVFEPSRELFDAYGFDMDLWDKSTGADVRVNLFELDRALFSTERLWVTLNGTRLLPGTDYSLSDDGLTLAVSRSTLTSNDELAVTMITDSVVPDALGFRIFKDMRDNTAVYRITDDNTTYLTQPLKWTDDVIYVNDVSKLGEPDLDSARFGIISINGERITYRERNLETNSVSGLRRGTAGTAIVREYNVSTKVIDFSRGQLLQTPYDEVWYEQGLDDDSTTITPSNGISLQQQTTRAARFLRGE